MTASWRSAGAIWAQSDMLLRQAHALTEEPEPEDEAEEFWTLARIRSAGRIAASRVRTSPEHAREVDLVGVAMSGVGLAVAINPGIPWWDAVNAGQDELWATISGTRKAHNTDVYGAEKPRWAMYWRDQQDPYPSPTRCETVMTLAEVLSALPAQHLDTLLLAAFSDTIAEAADAAGILPTSFNHRLAKARSAALRLWFDHEEPPALKRLPIYRARVNRMCPQGHPITSDNIRRDRSSGRTLNRCLTCRAAADKRRRERKKEATRD